ncbi:chitobiosyldiphosphodolichol beta-mannosyltransferase-like protein [Cunninghamella echinulata]|nr:chitobiosyldiphosphodolichol beta-mannosyltransferase-like protein [Cunninghamella echinulata]
MRPRLVVQVVVLGDIARSPRICSHAISLADSGCTVDLIGYQETPLGVRLKTNRYIRVRPIYSAWSIPKGLPKLFYLLWAPFKAFFISLQLLWTMGCITQYPDFVFIQNPPAIPTLFIAKFVATIRQAWLIIDWHNFGYSVLGTNIKNKNHPVVKFAKKYEKYFGRNAYAHLTVTDAMNEELKKWNVQGKLITFRDRPLSHFKRLSLKEIHEFFNTFRLEKILQEQSFDVDTFLGYKSLTDQQTILTEVTPNGIQVKENRPRIIVSSTSWTEDEDFQILLNAIDIYEQLAADSKKNDLPNLLFVITGKGPLKDDYEKKISKMKLTKTRIITAWLEQSQYPLLLGSADLGVSLHTSTSGMDLPMKVVDMFGCGLPVCALNFKCLDELVQDKINGRIFNDSGELANQLWSLFIEQPDELATLRNNVISEYTTLTWEKQWKDILIPQLFPSA